MASEIRSFSMKRSKVSAAEIRRQIVEGNYLFHNSPTLVQNSNVTIASEENGASQKITLSEVTAPIDIEEALSSRLIARSEIKSTSLSPQRIRDLTEKDVELVNVPRIKHVKPEITSFENGQIEHHIKDLLKSYDKDYVVVEHKHAGFGSGESFKKISSTRSQLVTSMPVQIFESDFDHDPVKQRKVTIQNEEKRQSTYSSSSSSSKDSQPEQLNSSASDSVIPDVLLRSSCTKLDDIHEKKRASNRISYIVNLLPLPDESEVVEIRKTPSIPSNLSAQCMLIRILQLQLEPLFEPLFGTLAFYDIHEKRKITENFYFDLNPDETLALIRAHSGVEEEASKCCKAFININALTTGVFIVFKLEKVLQGVDISDAVEPYLKEDKNKERLCQNAREYCERLGAYRMPFAWTAIDLSTALSNAQALLHTSVTDGMPKIDEDQDTISTYSKCPGDNESIISADRTSCYTTTETPQHIHSAGTISSQTERSETPLLKRKNVTVITETNENLQSNIQALQQPVTININSFYKQETDKISDDELIKLLCEAKKSSSKFSRLKSIPVDFKIELSVANFDEIPAKLSPELCRIQPFVREISDPLTKEVLEFPKPRSFSPNLFYRNLLFVYPKNVNMSGRSGNARNIAIKIELMNAKMQALPVIFGKSSTRNVSTSTHTSVIYHNKNPQFSDEVKMQLPIDLNDGHHLLFTFYHISCKTSKPTEAIETPIGYTWHPLYKDGQLQTGDFMLPISLEPLPPSICYVSPLVNMPNIKWLENHKPLFSVHISPVSTVHAQDSYLNAFFVAFHSFEPTTTKKLPATEEQLKIAIKSIIKSKPEPLVAFLYIVLDKLLTLIARPPYSDQLTQVCFETMCQLVKVCTMLLDDTHDIHGRSQMLITYIHFHKLVKEVVQKPSGSGGAPLAKFDESIMGKSSRPESVNLIELIKSYEKSTSGKPIVEEVVDGSTKLIHEELAKLFANCTGNLRETACTYSWFFLELIHKSMAEFLAQGNRFFLPRKLRFRDTFLLSVMQLCNMLSSEVIEKVAKDYRQAKSINSSLAFFLRDCLSLMDRSFIMNMVKKYCNEVIQKINNSTEPLQTSLITLKIAFLRIICSHEHFTLLNMPFEIPAQNSNSATTNNPFKTSSSLTGLNAMAPIENASQTGAQSSLVQSACSNAPPSPSGSSSLSSRCSNATDSQCPSNLLELTPQYRSKHFLLGIVLSDLASILNSSNSTLHAQIISLVRSILATHETDARLADGALKNRVASLYLPLVGIVMDIRNSICDPYFFQNARNSFCGNFALGPGVNPRVAMAISGISSSESTDSNIKASESENSLVMPKYVLPMHLSKQLLSCFVWTLKNIEQVTLLHWLRELPPHRVQHFVELLQLSISIFEYRPPEGFGSNRNSMLGEPNEAAYEEYVEENFRKISYASGCVDEQRSVLVRWRSEEPKISHEKRSTNVAQDVEQSLEKNLSTEVLLSVLDTVETLIKVLSMPASDHLLFILPALIRILMHMLACNQSVQSLENIFATERSIVAKFPELIFEQRAELCSELCLQLLRHLASKLPAVRSQAAASLYLLMRHSFEHSFNFSKVKMQITMSLSTLVSNASSYGFLLNESNLRRSLKTMLTYLENDLNADMELRESSFGGQVKDLVFNLHMILSDTVKMKSFSNDFEMLIDLMYRIAKGYQNNPDLRLTWLINIANKHADKGNQAEAAQCMLHCAALVSEYMSMHSYDSLLPKGAVDLAHLSENILEESATSDDVISPDEEGICESLHFSTEGFVHLIEKTASFFDKAQMYELVAEVYKMILPILEETKDFHRLARVHSQISETLKKVDQQIAYVQDVSDAFETPLASSDKRCFGTYFRVGLYGYRFGDLNGDEYIYKEPAITKLSEISHRLEAFYAERLGRSVIEVIKDSNDVDPRKLNPEKAYLQITYVEPYLDVWEKRRRSLHFEHNYKLNRFVYATPFTKEGKAHGELKDQYKRRTILTTQHSFPYLKTRIRVISREQYVLSPIEVAIEDIQKKTRELAAATIFSPPDAKILQMVLQGCIGTTVNQGPIQIAKVFMTNMDLDERGKPRDRLQNKLRLCFRDFSKKCSDALNKNEQLIQADQVDYQKELKKNYLDFTNQLSEIMGSTRVEQKLVHAPIQLHTHTVHALAAAAEGPVSNV